LYGASVTGFNEETVVLDYFEDSVSEEPDRQIERDRDDIPVSERSEEINALLS
jgi:hypothetical protein